MNLGSRIITSFRVSLASSIPFASIGTALATLALVPLLSVSFDVLFGVDLAAPDARRIAVASLLIAIIVGVSSGVASKVATDRNLGVFQEVHSYRRFDLAYWAGSAVIPMLSTMPFVLAVLWVSAAFPGVGTLHAGPILVVSISCLMIGALLGVFASGVAIGLPDPYLGATIVATIIPITAGVVVPTELYPDPFRELTNWMPATSAMGTLANPTLSVVITNSLRDVALASAFALVGLFSVHHAVISLRNGRRLDPL